SCNTTHHPIKKDHPSGSSPEEWPLTFASQPVRPYCSIHKNARLSNQMQFFLSRFFPQTPDTYKVNKMVQTKDPV
ncbi:MAG: hypothetical protein QGD94_08950, partial [Planctomycetia bacterium]|nr:hypothetical protein [Planctomycetia bacterium]